MHIQSPFKSIHKRTAYRRVGVLILTGSCLLMAAGTTIRAQRPAGPADTSALLIRRIYPFIAKLNAHPTLKATLASYAPLRKIARTHQKRLKKELTGGALEKAVQDIQLNAGQVQTIVQSLVHLNSTNQQMASTLKQLRESGAYSRDKTDADSVFLRKMIESLTKGLDHIARVYLFGEKPTYGKIDAISIDIKDQKLRAIIQDSLRHWTSVPSGGLFYSLPLKVAVMALRLNGRTEAVWYDPLTGGMNAAPVAAIQNTDFSKYTYSAILVPGLGPEKPGVRLTEGGKARCRMALAEFAKGQAPFLIVSGGHVHPNKTPFCEAVEMKKYMVDSLHMDGARILIEPYARHTTTNLRNATRLIQLTGMPFNRPVLIVTDPSQSAYINKGMRKTSLRDLGYTPYQDLKILSPTQTVFTPDPKSFIVNPMDPLDP